MAALRRALDSDDQVVAVADVDWQRFAPVFTSARPRPLISDIPEVAELSATSAVIEDGGQTAAKLRKRLSEVSEADQSRLLVDMVRTAAAEVIGYDSPYALESTRPFRDLGFDSLTAIELRGRLARATGLTLPSSIVFDYPTPVALADYLRAELLSDAAVEELPTLEELDRLESALSLRAQDDIGRVRVVMRLQSLLERLGAPDTGPTDRDSLTDRLRSATNEELFDLIDKDLGLA